MPQNQRMRELVAKMKLIPVESQIRGKRLLFCDDSIVRGTTCARIVRLLRSAGATEVHLRSSAPPFLNPCYYGTDIDSKDALIANNHTVEEIARITGADTLGYLRLEDVYKLGASGTCKGYCTACFDGNYPTETPSCLKSKYDSKISENKNN